ncbi:MAG: hypothetical protein H8D67_25495, partial [Deltaproteobacteria bacterium]|nr:hypothetical protein [Deltaproteobacteria bacterium]
MSTINDVFKDGLTDWSYYLSVDTIDSTAIAMVVWDNPDMTLEILRNHRMYLILLPLDVDEKLRGLIATGKFDLNRCVESADGVDYLLESVGMDKNLNSVKDIPDEDEILRRHGLERTPEGWLPEGVAMKTLYKNAGVNVDVRYCYHRIMFACDANTFIPANSHSELVAKIEKGHPWWLDYDIYGTRTTPSSNLFRCVIVQNDKLIAQARASYLCDIGPDGAMLPVDKIFTMSAWVRYGYRRKGYGKAVASAA